MEETTNSSYFGSEARYRYFTALKYLVYVLLSFNIYMFLQEELSALEHTFVGPLEPGQIIQAFSATIDTAAWVLLLLLFELETSVLDDSRINGPVKWCLHGVRGLCYLAIGYAFFGYYAELITLYDVAPLMQQNLCALAGDGYSLAVDIDEYVPLDATNCVTLSAGAAQINGFNILVSNDVLQAIRRLAWTDIFNSAAWILVVIVLEVEVRLQLRGKLSSAIMDTTKYVKLLLYTTLFAAAGYWGYAGDFIDVWDASLWLFAFIFIELNVFEWQYETTHQPAAP